MKGKGQFCQERLPLLWGKRPFVCQIINLEQEELREGLVLTARGRVEVQIRKRKPSAERSNWPSLHSQCQGNLSCLYSACSYILGYKKNLNPPEFLKIEPFLVYGDLAPFEQCLKIKFLVTFFEKKTPRGKKLFQILCPCSGSHPLVKILHCWLHNQSL